jgi:hypothetical protein
VYCWKISNLFVRALEIGLPLVASFNTHKTWNVINRRNINIKWTCVGCAIKTSKKVMTKSWGHIYCFVLITGEWLKYNYINWQIPDGNTWHTLHMSILCLYFSYKTCVFVTRILISWSYRWLHSFKTVTAKIRPTLPRMKRGVTARNPWREEMQ